ncbi:MULTISPECIES: glycoside hydrolase family 113 [unclassified Bradyrhizobium]
MATLFDIQGFGALSEWGGQLSAASARQAFQSIASIGSNSILLSTRIWTDNGASSSVFPVSGKTEGDQSLLAGFQAARDAGLSIVFRPSLSPLDGTRVSSLAPSDVGAFFASYKAEVVHLATIAQAGGVDTFVIGNEMSSLTGPQYRAYWVDIISAVRLVFHGEITYAAATDEASHVSFWDQLDVIGVNTYPPLTSSTTPTVDDLVHAWNEVPTNPYFAAAFDYKSPVDFLHSLALQYDKPVLMTEAGYRSIEGTAIAPGSWASGGDPDPAAQADAYNAFFQVWASQGGSWLKGVELWQWDLSNQYSAAGYSVMGKPSASIVSQYFHDQGFIPDLTVTGTPAADIIDLGRGSDNINAALGNDVIHGGAGNDIIVGGPTTIAPSQTTTLTMTGYGSMVAGVGAQVRVWVNGQLVSGIFEFKPAADASGYQTFSVTFNNPGTVHSLDIELVNSTPGRALHLKNVSINGIAVSPSDATNASAPGTFDLYVRMIHFDTTNHQDWFLGGTTDNDVIDGGAGNDYISGGAGNDVVDGGEGLDTALFSGKRSDYDIAVSGNTITVNDHVADRDGADRLTNVEYLKFADTTVVTSTMLAALAGVQETRTLDVTGSQTTETIRHTDGSRDIFISGVADKDYASQHVVTDTSGHSILIEQFRTDGSLLLTQSIDMNGVRTLDRYDASMHLVEETVTQTDGAYQQSTYAADGSLAAEILRHADGSRDVFNFNFVDKPYASQHVLSDAAGHSLLVEQFRDDGSLWLKQMVDAAGVKTLDLYDTAGHVTLQTVTQTDGSYVQSNYDPDGGLTVQTTRHADGTREVDTYQIQSQAYSAKHDLLDTAGHRLATTYDNNDGSHTMSAAVPGVTLASTAGKDIMNSAGGDTFVFKEASGHDVINHFRAGEGPGHDVLQIDSSVASDVSHLAVHLVGHDTVIDLGHDASITLTGVTAPLTQHDLLIV